ncbi:MAG: D-alanyl-D-alanine carboxypeptidase family protein [Planococcus sp. (in: firmicutes)]|nr:D-alanyl-D-alanine carboxypeptidase family protein [Planococcus sp. (in: firmicutes)]
MTKNKMTTKAVISTAVLTLAISIVPTGNAFSNTEFGLIQAEASTATHVAKGNLNLRSGGSLKDKIILQIPKGGKIEYISGRGIWYKVKYGTKTGYVHSGYLAKIGEAEPSKYPAPSTDTPGKYVEDILIVNKKYALPSTYNPGINATAKKALDAMIADAKKQSVILKITSSYRSYWYQNTLYNNYVKKHGKAKADRFSARPGHSEHQTGLAFDLGGVNQAHWFEESFADTKEGKWLASNAHKYGFHLRYQKGKEDITGYMFEPWHFRYIGEANATNIKASGKTLEEYFDILGK